MKLSLAALLLPTALLVLSASAQQQQQQQRPSAMANRFLMLHNIVRSNVARGIQQGANGTELPSAQNMYALRYDTALEKRARQVVAARGQTGGNGQGQGGRGKRQTSNSCALNPRAVPANGKMALNTATLKGRVNQSEVANVTVGRWLQPVNRYGLPANLRLTNQTLKRVGPFVRMIWPKAYRMGCASRVCGSGQQAKTLVACVYAPANVKAGQQIYQQGAACQSDAQCTTYANSVCNTTHGLCIFQANSNTTSTTTSSPGTGSTTMSVTGSPRTTASRTGSPRTPTTSGASRRTTRASTGTGASRRTTTSGSGSSRSTTTSAGTRTRSTTTTTARPVV